MSRATVTTGGSTVVVAVTRNRVAVGVPLLAAHNALQDRDADDAHPISAITGLQAELDGKLTNSPNVEALSALTGAADQLSYFTGVGAMALTTLTGFGRSFIGCANSAAALAVLGTIPWASIGATPTTLAGYGIADAQPLDADLTAIAALSTTSYGRSLLALADDAAGRASLSAEYTGNKGIAGGYASLDGSGKIPSAQLPAIAITDTFVVVSQVAMLALTAETGDVAVRSDQNKSYILRGTNPAVLGDWQELLTPTDTVLSVNGFTGAVTIGASDLTTGTLAAARGGTGVSNTGTITNASNTTITGGGTIALGGFTFTVNATGTGALIAANNAFTGANTFTSASGITTLQAATQDAMRLLGRSSGTGSWIATITTPALSASRTWTGVDATDTFAFLGQAQTFTAINTINTTGSASTRTNTSPLCIVGSATSAISIERYAGNPRLEMLAAEGTVASPTFPNTGRLLFNLVAAGWTAAGTWTTGGQLKAQTTETWSATVRGLSWIIAGTTTGTTSLADWVTVAGGASEPANMGAVGIGAAPTTGNGLLQLASGTTKAYGIAWGTDTFLYRSAAGVLKHNSAQLVGTSVGFTNGAAAATGTLLNAPAAGNPTRWIPVDDNGTTRYVPAW